MLIYYFRKLNLLKEWKENLKNKGFIKPFQAVKNKKWLKIEKLLAEEFPVSWKLAVIESGELVFNALKNLGYKGNNFKEISNQLKDQNFQNLEILKQAFENLEKLLKNNKAEITQAEAKNTYLIFKKFYSDLFSAFI
ncbi:MAG: hypothetical protein ACP5OX_01195 [Minisyncoccia bacterium]